MGHFLLQALCFLLEASAFNLMFLGGLMLFKRTSGSAFMFAAGAACLLLNFGLATSGHLDLAKSLSFAGMTAPLIVPILVRRMISR